ncbi:hypothetical protein [Streptomyces sp. NPDC090083]|uniref:hypothetical protein n=1 Tax=Streptomyces sp. NPDC090083 TaxID=3365941 RepID=UPI003807CAEC
MTQGNSRPDDTADAAADPSDDAASADGASPPQQLGVTSSPSSENDQGAQRGTAGGGGIAALELPLALVLSLISAPVAIVADRPASSIGVVIAVTALAGAWIHRSISLSKKSGDAARAKQKIAMASYVAAGAAVLFTVLLVVPATRAFVMYDLLGFSAPQESIIPISVRTGEKGSNKVTRQDADGEAKKGRTIEFVVQNRGDTDELVKVVHLTVPSDYEILCETSGDYSAKLDSEAAVVRTETATRIDWTGTFKESGSGNKVDFDATLVAHCGRGSEVKFSIPIFTALPQRKFTRISLELPLKFQMSGEGFIAPREVKIVLPHESGADSSGAGDHIPVDLEVTGNNVVTYR